MTWHEWSMKMISEMNKHKAKSKPVYPSREGKRLRRKWVIEKISFKFFKKLRSRQCKRMSVRRIGTQFSGKIIPKSRSSVIERSVRYFKARRVRRTSKSDNWRGASGTRTLKAKKRTKIRWLIRKKNFVGERYDFVMNSLIYFKPMKWFKNWSNVMKPGGFGDSTSSRVKYKLKTICRRCRKIEQKWITVIKFGMNKSSSNGTRSSLIYWASKTSQIPNMIETRFRNGRDMFRVR
jgi:hypothetical protein